MVDTLIFTTNQPLKLDNLTKLKETKRGTRYLFENFHIEINKHYPITRISGSLSSYENKGNNYPLIAINSVESALKKVYEGIQIDPYATRIERIDTAIDISTQTLINPHDFSTLNKSFVWGESTENSILTNISSIQKVAIYQNGNHNNRPNGLRFESRYTGRPFARNLKEITSKKLISVSQNMDSILNNFEFKAPELDLIAQFLKVGKPNKKDVDRILANGYLHYLSEIDFQNLINILKNIEVDRRIIKGYKVQRFNAIKEFKKGVIIDPIYLFKKEIECLTK